MEIRLYTNVAPCGGSGSWRIRGRIINTASRCPLASFWSQSLKRNTRSPVHPTPKLGQQRGSWRRYPWKAVVLMKLRPLWVHSQQGVVGLEQGCSLVEWKFMLLSLCLTSIPADMATIFTSLMGKDRCCSEKRLTNSHRIGHLTRLIIKLLFCEKKKKIFSYFAYSERSIHRLLPRPPCYQCLSGILPSPWPSNQTISHCPWTDVIPYVALSPSI